MTYCIEKISNRVLHINSIGHPLLVLSIIYTLLAIPCWLLPIGHSLLAMPYCAAWWLHSNVSESIVPWHERDDQAAFDELFHPALQDKGNRI